MENTYKKSILQIIGLILLGAFMTTLFFSVNIVFIRFAIFIETICFVAFLFKLKLEYEEHCPDKMTWYLVLVTMVLFIFTMIKFLA